MTRKPKTNLRALLPAPLRRLAKRVLLGSTSYCAHIFFRMLINKTQNFGHVKWLGHPIWQNILDLWVIQETIAELKPQLLIECGTNRGGSALFYAHLFDLLGHGRVITIDIERMHNLVHPRITFLIGSSVDPHVVKAVGASVGQCSGPIMVVLDSDHSAPHVLLEMQLYSPFVTLGSFLLVQDGVIDTFDAFRAWRPGPLHAIRVFLASHPEFTVDGERSTRFVITHHPDGWLRRVRLAAASQSLPAATWQGAHTLEHGS